MIGIYSDDGILFRERENVVGGERKGWSVKWEKTVYCVLMYFLLKDGFAHWF